MFTQFYELLNEADAELDNMGGGDLLETGSISNIF